MNAAQRVSATIPARAGIGLRAPHYRDIIETRPDVAWLEVHSENYFGDGGAPLYYLERAREHYPVSLHGVGLSLGSTDPLNRGHLRRLKQLIDRIEPGLVSEHLCWSSVDGRYLNDLLPLPYTEEALRHVAARIVETQDFLGRRILIENLSNYLQFSHSAIPEWEFLAAVAQRADCDILLDVNNIYVSARNHRFDPLEYARAIPAERIKEIHLAGHTVKQYDDGEILIDTHNARVCDEVWGLYDAVIKQIGARPTLIEWDSDLPTLSLLVQEADAAEHIMERRRDAVAA
ncbi:MAG TPA: DUF692 domain-containing protein [Burkholderiales bacterium]|nr:DUF692 domain-containing protein [Burkholderiales bacterium]